MSLVSSSTIKFPESYEHKEPTISTTFTQQRVFHKVDGTDDEKMRVISEIFNRILTPLYGSQDKAIEQIKESKDRLAYLLYENKTPTGVLVFKTELSDEFKDFGVDKSVEIKSLFIDHSIENSGRGLGSSLVDKLKTEVAQLGLNEKGIHVTVSETKQESLSFFQKKGFVISHAWKDRYVKGVTEYLLFCPTKINQIEKFLFAEEFKSSSSSSIQIPELVHIIHHAHSDDIHSLEPIDRNRFLSGSKDNSILMWDSLGKLVLTVDDVEPTEKPSSADWITSLKVISPEYFVSGKRNGNISLWRSEGTYVKDLLVKLPKRDDHIAHQYNMRRVNCFAPGLHPYKPSIFIGFPTMFDEFNLIEGRTQTSTIVNKNDWVYSICPTDEHNNLVVVGGRVEIWSQQMDGSWGMKDTIIKEGAKKLVQVGSQQKFQRPFISSMELLKLSSPQIAVTQFDGTFKICDLSTKKVTHIWQAHQGRIWECKELSNKLLATCGDDQTVKLFDFSQKEPIHTIKGHPGPVNSIASLGEHTLLSGSCSLDKKTGGEIRFFDLRKL